MKRYNYESETNYRNYEGHKDSKKKDLQVKNEKKEKYAFSFEREHEYAGFINKPKKYQQKIQEAVGNDQVAELITAFRDTNFSNEEERKYFIDLITSLFNLKDKDARKFFKKVGSAMTTIANEMLKDDIAEVTGEDVEVETNDDKTEIELGDTAKDSINPSSKPDGVLV